MGMGLTVAGDGKIAALLAKLVDPDFTQLMERVGDVIAEDHTRAIMMGQDKDGISFKPVTYRGDRVFNRIRRNRANAGVGAFKGTANDNLTSAQYRKLTGPPLAPRGMDSRIITNFFVETGWNGSCWFARAGLAGIVSAKGVPFMKYHFDGARRLPRRDDRGIRPWGRDKIQAEVRRTVKRMLSGQ